jgi:3-dehydroquinate synthase
MRDSSSVHVQLGPRSYDVLVGHSLLHDLGTHARTIVGKKPAHAFVVVDRNIPRAMVDRASHGLRSAGFHVHEFALSANEPAKSLATLEAMLVELERARHERVDPIIALGGGITGDLGGFAAATYRRGVPFIQCPSTLLAMVDASVGGKTGVNIEVEGTLRKNMVGAFWQPRLVLADLSLLDSLPKRELRAGLAECVKHGLIGSVTGDASLLRDTIALLPKVLALDHSILVEFVRRNIAVKASLVSRDEREESSDPASNRALLNLGHTFAHAIETLPFLTLSTGESSPILHGEAVAIGLVAATRCAVAAGVSPPELADRVVRTISECGLPVSCKGLPQPSELISEMMHDKKVTHGRLRLILPTGEGAARVFEDIPLAHVESAWNSIRSS